MMSPQLIQEVVRRGRLTLPMILPIVFALIATGDAIGIDQRPRFRPFLAAAAKAEGLPLELLGLSDDQLLHPPRDEQIAVLYEELADLADAVAIDPSYQGEYEEALAQLRVLQEAEAGELRASFEARSAVDERALDAALRQARDLLGNDADPSEPNQPA